MDKHKKDKEDTEGRQKRKMIPSEIHTHSFKEDTENLHLPFQINNHRVTCLDKDQHHTNPAALARAKRKLAIEKKRSKHSHNSVRTSQMNATSIDTTSSLPTTTNNHGTPLTNITASILNDKNQHLQQSNNILGDSSAMYTQPSANHQAFRFKKFATHNQSIPRINLFNKFTNEVEYQSNDNHTSKTAAASVCRSIATMDIERWNSSDRRSIQLGRSCNENEQVNSLTACGSSKLRWKMLWMKLKKEKKKLFECASLPLQVPYDPYTYSQNFDQGTALDEPDNLSSSFSARFSDPSRAVVLVKKRVV